MLVPSEKSVSTNIDPAIDQRQRRRWHARVRPAPSHRGVPARNL